MNPAAAGGVATLPRTVVARNGYVRENKPHFVMIANESLLNYYERSSCSMQWLEFHRALAEELTAGLPSEEVRKLFSRLGSRMAEALPVVRCNTLEEMEALINERWRAIGWGFSVLKEDGDHLTIEHACSPLAMAFGPESGQEWTEGFLEGAYAAWFTQQGMPPALRVHAQPSVAHSLQVQLLVGTHP